MVPSSFSSLQAIVQAKQTQMAEPLSNGACYRSVPESYTLPAHKRPGKSDQTEAAPAIPVVDLGGDDHDKIVEQVFNAGREFGFFQVINHGVSGEVMGEMMRAAEEFFMLPTEEKMAYYSTDTKKVPRFHTSVGNADEKLLYWRDCLKLGCYPLDQFKPNWPDNPPRLRPALEAYTAAVRAVARRLLRLTAAGLAGVDEGRFVDGELSNGPVLMNVNHYVPCPDPTLTLGLAPHCDPNLVTVLMASGAGGLQASLHGRWVDVEPLPGAFVVNFGHQMEAVTNGRVRSGEHRVVNSASAARTSVATFFMPEMGCTVAPAPELQVADGGEALYRPYTYEEFVAVYSAETGDRDAVLAHFQINKQ